MIAIKDIPNAIQGWYKASRTYPKKILEYREKLSKLSEALNRRKLQQSNDGLFKEIIRKKHPETYWEAVEFMKQKNCETNKEFGKAIEELKVGTYKKKIKDR
jgi:hypothetical protein